MFTGKERSLLSLFPEIEVNKSWGKIGKKEEKNCEKGKNWLKMLGISSKE